MKYLYKNASYEAVNRVNYYRSIIKQADFKDFMSSLGEYKNPLIGAGIGMGLGYLLSPENKKLLGTLGGGVLGGLGGWGFGKWFGSNGDTVDVSGKDKDTLKANPNPNMSVQSRSPAPESTVSKVTPEDNRYSKPLVHAPSFYLAYNDDGSIEWNINEEKYTIPKSEVDALQAIYPDIWESPGMTAFYLNPFPVDSVNTRDNKGPNYEYYARRSQPYVMLKKSKIPKDPSQQLDLFYRGLIGIPPHDGAFSAYTVPVFSGFNSYATEYIANHPDHPELKFLGDPNFYDTYEPGLFTDRLQELMQDYNLSSYDIGNPYSEKWNNAKEAFIRLGQDYAKYRASLPKIKK